MNPIYYKSAVRQQANLFFLAKSGKKRVLLSLKVSAACAKFSGIQRSWTIGAILIIAPRRQATQGRLLYISILFLAPLAALREILGLACPAALGPSSWSAAQLRAERLEFATKYAPLSSGLFDRHFHRFNGRRELLPDFSVDLISNIFGEQLRAGVNKR